MASRNKRANSNRVNTKRRIYRLLKPILKILIGRNYKLTVKVPEDVQSLKPPYLVLPNHQGYWDGVMVGVYLPHPVFYVATDATFRSGGMRFIMNIAGVIPKTKGMADLESLRAIVRVKEAGGVIGLFPEAKRTWDGTTGPLLFSVARLVRLLKIPVVSAVIRGGYFTNPRWGLKTRKGRIEVAYSLLFNAEETAALSSEILHEKMSDALAHDEYEYLEKEQITFQGKNPAENLEQALFLCPSCRRIGSLYSEKDRFYCIDCGYDLTFTPEQRFRSHSGNAAFETIRSWNLWQREAFDEILEEKERREAPLAQDENLLFRRGFRSKRSRAMAEGSMELNAGKLILKDRKSSELISFPVNELEGIDAQNGEVLEFYHEGSLYIIRSKEHRLSVNKWLQALDFAREDK